MTIVEVQIPKRSATKAAMTAEDLEQAVELLDAGRQVGSDETFDNRKNAQTAGWNLRNAIADGSAYEAGELRSETYQDEGEDVWRVAVFRKGLSGSSSSASESDDEE